MQCVQTLLVTEPVPNEGVEMKRNVSRAEKNTILALALVVAIAAPHLTYAAERIVLGEYINGTW